VARHVAIANEKGGAGKTTTAINLGAALGEAGERVLLVDLDARADLTLNLGVRLGPEAPSVYALMVDERQGVREVVRPVEEARVAVAPAERDLAAIEVLLGDLEPKERTALARGVLRRLGKGFDWVLIDCPPGLSRLVVAVMQCVDWVLVPQQCSFTALHGLRALEQTIEDIERAGGRRPPAVYVVLTMTTHTLHSAHVEEMVRARFGDAALRTTIPTTVRAQEAPEYALPLTVYDPRNKAAEAYRALAKEVLSHAS
jgi:chromosome partitioning protein